MDAQELRELEEKQLVDHIKTTRRDLFGIRFQNATGELENTASLRSTKRGLARALTIAQERGIDTSNI